MSHASELLPPPPELHHQPELPPPPPEGAALVVTVKVNVLNHTASESDFVVLYDDDDVRRTCKASHEDMVPAALVNHPPLIAYNPPDTDISTGTSIPHTVTVFDVVTVERSAFVCVTNVTVFGVLSYKSTKIVIPVATLLSDTSNPVRSKV